MRHVVMSSVIASAIAWGLPASAQNTLSRFTENVLIHVIAHEIGHAVLREFDLPILGPEEAIAEDFATIYVHMRLPDRAGEIVADRARQHRLDGVAPEPFSEYRGDLWRAGRNICLLHGLDPARFEPIAREAGMTGDEAATCRDFAPEVARSWRRVLARYLMPDGARVTEVDVIAADTPLSQAVAESGVLDIAYDRLAAIDWHSMVRLHIDTCDGSGGWARNGRTITICEPYIARFESQAP